MGGTRIDYKLMFVLTLLLLMFVLSYLISCNIDRFSNKKTASRRSPVRRSGRQNFSNKKTASRRSPVRRSGRQNFSNKNDKFSIDGYNNKEYYSI